MVSKGKAPLKQSLVNLQNALKEYQKKKSDNPLPLLTVTKAFEISVEYGWRELRMRVEDEGVEVQSPKAAVREAAKIGLIEDAKDWLLSIDARNNSVHDYFGVSEKDFIKIVERFLIVALKLV